MVKAHQRLNLPDLLGFQSRYEDEFIQLGHLGRGAYGSVFKVKQLCFYLTAIEKTPRRSSKLRTQRRGIQDSSQPGVGGGGQHTILPSFQKKNPHEIKNILVGRARDGAGEGRCAPPPYPPIIGLY